MEPSTTLSGSARTSPRWPSARMGLWKTSVRDLRETSPWTQSAPHIVTAASNQQFTTAPLPPTIKGPSGRQLPATKMTIEQEALWSSHSSLRPLVCTWGNAEISLQTFMHDPIAWLMNLVYRLQSILVKLFTSPQQNVSVPPTREEAEAALSTPSTVSPVSARTLIAAYEAATLRCSSGRYVPAGAARRVNGAAQSSTTLMAFQAPPVLNRQHTVAPIACLALATAAGLAIGCLLMFRRWRTREVEVQKEQAQRRAVKRDSLARQKQRFHRALVVDSVNLELAPIKDMDMQPGPVRIEKILSQGVMQQLDSPSGNSPRGNLAVGLAGDSLRQWQQFMSASRAKEVTNISGVLRGRHGSVDQPTDPPYMTLDDSMLADLSERIRRANEPTVSGKAVPPAPVITFEQLYANSQESDDEAMARRAAERKARWQKHQLVTPTMTGAPTRNHVAGRPPSAPSKPKPFRTPVTGTTTGSASKSQSSDFHADNPFAVKGLSTSPNDTLHSPAGQFILATSRNSSASNGIKARDPHSAHISARRGSDLSSSQVKSVSTARSNAWVPPRPETGPSPRSQVTASGYSEEVAASCTEVNQSVCSARANASASYPSQDPHARVLAPDSPASTPEEVNSNLCQQTLERLTSGHDALSLEIGSTASSCIARTDGPSSSAVADSLKFPPSIMVSGGNELQNSPSHPFSSPDEDGIRRRGGSVVNPSQIKRAPAAGKLRTSNVHEPGLTRLMRRPSTTTANSD